MIHYMKLNQQPFDMIYSGIKTIELRLNDEKRSRIKIGDTIVFSNVLNPEKQMNVIVVNVYKFATFEELYKFLPLDKCGYLSNELLTASPKDMEEYYTKEQQMKYGVLGIEIQLIDNDE